MKYEIYVDVFWVTNVTMDVLILILVRYIQKKQSSIWRILCAAGVCATASLILFLCSGTFLRYQLCVHLIVNPLMVLIGFREKYWKDFVKDLVEAYVLMVFLGGIMSWGMETLGQWNYFWIWLFGGCSVCIWMLQRMELHREKKLCYEVLLITRQDKLKLTGFLDTGNLLTDPIMRQPVHIIQEKVLQDILIKEQLPIRYIPFHSLGQEHGLLPAVTLKAMYIKKFGEKGNVTPAYIEKPVFGLAKEKLFQQKSYQIILNARCNLT